LADADFSKNEKIVSCSDISLSGADLASEDGSFHQKRNYRSQSMFFDLFSTIIALTERMRRPKGYRKKTF